MVREMWPEHGTVEHAEERKQKSHVVDFPAAERSDIHIETRVSAYWCIGLALSRGTLRTYTREHVWDHRVLLHKSYWSEEDLDVNH